MYILWYIDSYKRGECAVQVMVHGKFPHATEARGHRSVHIIGTRDVYNLFVDDNDDDGGVCGTSH